MATLKCSFYGCSQDAKYQDNNSPGVLCETHNAYNADRFGEKFQSHKISSKPQPNKNQIENVHIFINATVKVYIRRRDQRTREYTPTATSLGRLARIVRQQNPLTIPYKDGWSAFPFPHHSTNVKDVKIMGVSYGG